METIFQLVAVALLGTAVYFYTTGVSDGVFICAILAACSFFIGFRFRIKKRMEARSATDDGPEPNPPVTPADQ